MNYKTWQEAHDAYRAIADNAALPWRLRSAVAFGLLAVCHMRLQPPMHTGASNCMADSKAQLEAYRAEVAAR